MKKNINNTVVAVLCVLLMISCKKSVDLNPEYTINGDKFFTKVDDYDFVLTGAYQRLKQNGLYGGVNGGSVFLSSVDIAADNFFSGPNNLGNLNTIFRWNYTADETVTRDAWEDAYGVIQQTNLAVRGIERFRATDALKVNRIEGQARALRAFMHFEIFRWWAPSFERNNTNLGIAYTDTFNVEQKPARLTTQQTYDKIESDLKIAKSLLANTDRAIQSVTAVAGNARRYIDTLVINAMLARVYLYAKQWDSAVKYTTLVVNARRLATPTEFPEIWQDASTREVIWAIDYQAGNASLLREIYKPEGNTPAQDEVSWRPVTALINSFAPSDVRTTTYFTSRNGITVPNKYFAKSSSTANPDGVVNFKVFRTAEMYLIRAEAYAMKNVESQALADLNSLRTARGAATGTETGATLMTAIQTERRKELFVEGHRFFDLKRTVRMINRSQNCTNYCTLASDAREWAFPIPQTEMIANPNMVQNPGY